ncbi:DNA cytosine methyltransferase [Moraxella nonliquefaciens]|nr:DNA cytosine methyltransferase [Moraxella nonliquefaciens]MDI4500552.1 DNA cytosine methyltransferase [Moraxella nonliquefaciens]
MRYLSLFSGIEACSIAWQSLGWECVGFSEIEPFPCALLAHHYPDTPNLGDVTKITEQQIKDLEHIDLVVFGSPCQNLSVAGNR